MLQSEIYRVFRRHKDYRLKMAILLNKKSMERNAAFKRGGRFFTEDLTPIMKCYPNKRSVLICMIDFRLYLIKYNRYLSEILHAVIYDCHQYANYEMLSQQQIGIDMHD